MAKAIVLLSGGIDSTVAFWWAMRKGWQVTPLTFHYYRRPVAERAAVGRVLKEGGIEGLLQVSLGYLREVDDLGTRQNLNPHLSGAPEGYIPARNMVFYSIAANYAEILGADFIVGGHNRGDPEEFPDSGPRFFEQMNSLLTMGLWSYPKKNVKITLPLRGKSKREVVGLGLKLGAPLELTWSCHHDGKKPCGKCSSCVERAAAFESFGLIDSVKSRRGKGIYRSHTS